MLVATYGEWRQGWTTLLYTIRQGWPDFFDRGPNLNIIFLSSRAAQFKITDFKVPFLQSWKKIVILMLIDKKYAQFWPNLSKQTKSIAFPNNRKRSKYKFSNFCYTLYASKSSVNLLAQKLVGVVNFINFFFICKCFAQLFSSYSLALYFFGSKILAQ